MDKPVALPERKREFTANGTPLLENLSWNACLDEIAKFGPLYTHPAPADPGEVERLRAEVEEWKRRCQYNADTAHDVARERDTLRAQLAERVIVPDGYAVVPIKPTKAMRDACRIAGKVSVWADMMAAALSASAEPSAPKCGNCESTTGKACNDKGCGYLEAGNGAPVDPGVSADEPGCPFEPTKHFRAEPGATITAADFVARYSQESGISVDEFYQTQVPMPDADSPYGWAAISNNPASIKAHVNIHLGCTDPIAPVERDERAEFEDHRKSLGLCVKRMSGHPDLYESAAACGGWEAWQARAALERKP